MQYNSYNPRSRVHCTITRSCAYRVSLRYGCYSVEVEWRRGVRTGGSAVNAALMSAMRVLNLARRQHILYERTLHLRRPFKWNAPRYRRAVERDGKQGRGGERTGCRMRRTLIRSTCGETHSVRRVIVNARRHRVTASFTFQSRLFNNTMTANHRDVL
jgi:hypothetical protein